MERRVLFFFFLFSGFAISSQTDSSVYFQRLYMDLIPLKKYEYTTIYGMKYNRTLLRVYSDRLTFYIDDEETDTIRVLKKEITSIRMLALTPKNNKIKKFQRRPHYSLCYSFSENALPMDSSSLFLRSQYLALTNIHVKIKGGLSIHSYLMGFLPVSVGVRYVKKLFDNHYLGINGWTMYFPVENRDTSSAGTNSVNSTENQDEYKFVFPAISQLSVRYSQGTFDKNITVGATAMAFHPELLNGLMYPHKSYSDFFFTYGLYAGATNRFGNRWKYDAEVFYFLNAFGCGVLSIKYLLKNYFSVQLGAGLLYSSRFRYRSSGKIEGFFPFPYFSMIYSPFHAR